MTVAAGERFESYGSSHLAVLAIFVVVLEIAIVAIVWALLTWPWARARQEVLT